MTTKCTSTPVAQELGALWAHGRDEPWFDVVIVGSGYGGSVAAAAFAGCTEQMPDGGRRALRVGVFERGRYWRPGEFASRFADLPGQVRLVDQNSGRVSGNAEGLFDMRLGDDVMALVASGVGGGSLINAGVLLEPRDGAFAHARWNDWRGVLDQLRSGGHFERARVELGGRQANGALNTIDTRPDLAQRPLRKTQALRKLRETAGSDSLPATPKPGPFVQTPISVAVTQGPNHAGVALDACTLCGDCMTGCNAGAKNSLDVNLLAKARCAEAEIYASASVISIKREPADKMTGTDAHWVLRVAHTDPDLQAREKGLLYVHAHQVILAAGSLGSTEILLRSRSDKLRFSRRLGEGFSCNGDNIAAVFRMPDAAHCSADEDTPADQRRVGPTITAHWVLDSADARSPLVEEFSVPAPLKRLFEEGVTTAAALHALPERDRDRHGGESRRLIDPLAVNPKHLEHTLLVGLVGHDDAAGSLRLPQPVRPREGPTTTGTLSIHWPQAHRALLLDRPYKQLERAVRRLSCVSRLVANPLWRMLPPALDDLVTQSRGPVLTVHPLGGCGIGSGADDGVVDQYGRVFDARAPQAAPEDPWFGSLVVLDGAIMPTSLGVNPALTITALALRAVEQLRSDWKFTPPAAAAAPLAARPRVDPPQHAPVPARAGGTTRVEIVERLSGKVRLDLGAAGPHCYIVELTLAYRPVALRALMSTLDRAVKLQSHHPDTRLRIYDEVDWEREQLRVRKDAQRADFVRFDARLDGELRFLHREASGQCRRMLRSGFAWFVNRGLRDTWQNWFPPGKGLSGALLRIVKSVCKGGKLLNLASHAGEVRRFDYDLRIAEVLRDRIAGGASLPVGSAIAGWKRLTYGLRANPWQQLTRLQLTAMPGLRNTKSAVLRLDPAFLAGIGTPLLRLTRQRDHASALADLASFGLYLARVLLYIHLWTFRKADAPSTAAPRRLPGKVDGVAPQITELVVDRSSDTDMPVKIRLSRYPPAKQRELPPLLMIHGYSASGSTFTHDTLCPSAAQFFRHPDRDRDVWVLDLRTSAGMPTATRPWSFEQAALIDIPAALLHIRAVTGQRVDVLAHCIGAPMLAMAMLVDTRGIRAQGLKTGHDTWLSGEQLGQLCAFQGTPRAGDEHPCIRRIVLSQKGPVLRYTDANVLRAYLLQSIRRVLLADSFQFRPPDEPTLTDELLDRLLASLPYPDADYDVENPRWPWARTGWTGTRHRMDALYGRAFSAANLRAQTLDAIDDLFGPMNLDTIAQTIHFVRFGAITNQAGRGEFVTSGRLRERWSGVPTFAVHGQQNGLADVDTQRLLAEHLGAAEVPLQVKPYPRDGHQDLLIGRGAAKVFADIEHFLSDKNPPERVAARARKHGWVCERPWIGPRIDVPVDPGAALRIASMGRPDQGRARLLLVPAGPNITGAAPALVSATDSASDDWLFVALDRSALAAAHGQGVTGWHALLLYESDETTALRPNVQGPHPAEQPRAAPQLPERTLGGDAVAAAHVPDAAPLAAAPPHQAATTQDASADPESAARRWLGDADADLRERCFVGLADLRRAARQRRARRPMARFAFTVASCQYPYGLIDPSIASASLAAMSRDLDRASLALFVGDQIYADATAGLIDATRRDERYDSPYDRALRVEPLRTVMRRVPVQVLPDDHELVDNWEPFAPKVRDDWPYAAQARQQAREFGLDAFFRYQRMVRGADEDTPVDLEFRHAGCPFLLLDARTRRSARGSTLAAADTDIISPAQWQTLKRWLRAYRDEVKFVATGSLLLPRRRDIAAAQAGASERSDTWDGYPGSLHALLAFISANQIRRTVFLSGDEHHSLLAEATLQPGNIKLVSIHASALYAPYPFANGRPEDFVEIDTISVAAGAVTVQVSTSFAPPGDGYARIEVCPGKAAVLHVHFRRAAGGGASRTVRLD